MYWDLLRSRTLIHDRVMLPVYMFEGDTSIRTVHTSHPAAAMVFHPQPARTLSKGVMCLPDSMPRIGSQCILLDSVCAFTSFQAPISWLERQADVLMRQPTNCSTENLSGDTSEKDNRLHEACRNNEEWAEMTSLYSSPQSREPS